MPSRPVRTADYSDADRRRLGEAVRRARRAAGFRSQKAMAAATNGKVGVRSISAIESAEPTVGTQVLEDVGRFFGERFADWNETTPKSILDGQGVPSYADAKPDPPTAPAVPPLAKGRQRQLLEAVVENLQDDMEPDELLGLFAEIISEMRRKKTTDGEGVDAAG